MDLKEKFRNTSPWLYLILKNIYVSYVFNFVRRKFNYLYLKTKFNFLPKSKEIKLHLGCGRVKMEGFINIDHHKTPATDYVLDAVNLPFPDGSIDSIESYHLIEHLPIGKLSDILDHWYRILKPGGNLILEFPDFDQAVRLYLAGNENRLNNIFGRQRFAGDTHLWGWNIERMKKRLEDKNFKVEQENPQDYHTKTEPCLRIVAHKD